MNASREEMHRACGEEYRQDPPFCSRSGAPIPGVSPEIRERFERDREATNRLAKPDVSHYNGTIEPIDYMRETMPAEAFRGFLWGNVIKYTSRFHRKGGVADLRKARVYLDWLIQHEAEHDL